MGGSKKGERRGNARKRFSDAAPKRIRDGRRATTKNTEDYMRQIVLAVSSVRNGGSSASLPPRELIKEAQDWFHTKALRLMRILKVVEVRLDNADPTDRVLINEISGEMMQLGRDIDSAYLTAVECAFKNLPYFHAKISPASQEEQVDTPMQLLVLMMQEIDQMSRGEPTWKRPDHLKLVSSR